MGTEQNTRKFLNESIISDISAAVAALEYGDVTIKVHDKKIIQVEIAERKRFDDIWKIEGGGGI